MLNHHYPQTDEVSKERLDKLIFKAKQLSYELKVELFNELEESIRLALENAEDKADVKSIMTAGFTIFEHQLKSLPDQNGAEGFLHWNHIVFYKRFLKLEKNESVASLLATALHESKYWLVDLNNFGVLAKPKY